MLEKNWFQISHQTSLDTNKFCFVFISHIRFSNTYSRIPPTASNRFHNEFKSHRFHNEFKSHSKTSQNGRSHASIFF